MKVIACQTQGQLRAIHTRYPLLVDLIAEGGAPFQAEWNLFDDPLATNLRGLWKPWSVYEDGEVVYVTPEGPESGILGEHTPQAFGVFVAKLRTQHAEPGTGAGKAFWVEAKPWNTAGLTGQLIFPTEEGFNTTASISGSTVTVELSASQTKGAPSSLPYRLELHEGSNTKLYVARGIIAFRSLTGSR